jgi:putative ABC transport system permease protein
MGMLREILTIALRALRSHKMRSMLTMLGLVIGVAAVILLTSFGQGVSNSVNAAIEPVADNVTVVPKLAPVPGGPPAKPLTDEDEKDIAKIPGVSEVVPLVTGSTTGAAGQNATAITAQAGSAEYLSATVTGTTADYIGASQKKLTAGTFFDDEQSNSGARVAVLGPLVAQALFGPNPNQALNQTFRLQHVTFKVIGVLQSYGAASDNVIVVPEGAARSGVFGYGYGGDELSSIIVKATSTPAVAGVEQQINQVLSENHHITDPRYDDFQVQDLGSRLTTFTQLITLITDFVPAIAAVSLLVGGIGVLNIMLVSVTDRTREIGTRKAIGATDGAILTQFVLEAIALAGLGGLIGVVGGVGLIVVTKLLVPLLGTSGFLSSFDPVLAAPPILVAFAISLAIGLVAGGYPAWRAAQLNPIEALRYE